LIFQSGIKLRPRRTTAGSIWLTDLYESFFLPKGTVNGNARNVAIEGADRSIDEDGDYKGLIDRPVALTCRSGARARDEGIAPVCQANLAGTTCTSCGTRRLGLKASPPMPKSRSSALAKPATSVLFPKPCLACIMRCMRPRSTLALLLTLVAALTTGRAYTLAKRRDRALYRPSCQPRIGVASWVDPSSTTCQRFIVRMEASGVPERPHIERRRLKQRGSSGCRPHLKIQPLFYWLRATSAWIALRLTSGSTTGAS
jgi:hypothetical protein